MNFFVIGFLIMQAASFSLGDELGFAESLGNVEGGRRRAISYKNGAPELVGVLPSSQQAALPPPGLQYSPPDKRISSRSTGAVPYHAQLYNGLQKPIQPQTPAQLMTEARPLPLGVPAFRPIPKKTNEPVTQAAQRRIAVDTPIPRVSINNKLIDSYAKPHNNRTFHADNPVVMSYPVTPAVPMFQAMPDSISRIANVAKRDRRPEQRIVAKHPNYLQFEEPKFDLKDVTVEELAAAANVSVETIKHAIYVREQQMKAEHRAMLAAKLREEFIRTSTAKTTRVTTTTAAPITTTTIVPKSIYFERPTQLENKVSKVMNAPSEYYPVGYDKNFDDNFKSKVDLPATSFSCAKQKHFPGLYADTDLGCMVFHVCALTDDGLVRKSFLCPENTLFDQTILKCNWWLYVDCSTSTSVYDSNIPISKSYQLMKSLTYFSKFNQKDNADDDAEDVDGLDIQTLRKSMESVARKLQEVKKESDADKQPATESQDSQISESEERREQEAQQQLNSVST